MRRTVDDDTRGGTPSTAHGYYPVPRPASGP